MHEHFMNLKQQGEQFFESVAGSATDSVTAIYSVLALLGFALMALTARAFVNSHSTKTESADKISAFAYEEAEGVQKHEEDQEDQAQQTQYTGLAGNNTRASVF